MQCTSYHNFLHKKIPYLHALQGNGEMGARYLDPKYSRWISVDPALSDFVSGNSNGSSDGIYNPTNLNLYHYGNNNPIKYLDPDGRETIPLLSQKFGDYDYIPRIESIDTGNQYVDEFLGGLAFWWNLFAGCGAVVTNGIGAGFELLGKGIDCVDETIPYEWTLTGGGIKQDLEAWAFISGSNPQLFTDIADNLSLIPSYLKGVGSTGALANKIESLTHIVEKELGVSINAQETTFRCLDYMVKNENGAFAVSNVLKNISILGKNGKNLINEINTFTGMLMKNCDNQDLFIKLQQLQSISSTFGGK